MIPCSHLYLELTDRCNRRCAYCFQDTALRRTRDLPREEAERVLREFKALGGRYVTFSGGEPTLWPDWPSLAEFAANLGLVTTLATNGSTLGSHIDVLNRLRMYVAVSLDAARPEIHDALRGPDTFAPLHDALLRISEKGLSEFIILSYTPCSLNYRELPGLCRLALDLRIPHLSVSVLEQRFASAAAEPLALSQGEKVEFLTQLYLLKRRYAGRLKIGACNFRGFADRLLDPTYGRSDVIDRTLRVDAHGRIFLTAYLAAERFLLGDIGRTPLAEAWGSEQAETAREEAESALYSRCGACDAFRVCQGGSAMLSYQLHGTFSQADDWCEAKLRFLDRLRQAEHSTAQTGRGE
ncbi:MAG: radical SAM protein [FCB group bacterium]|nr:radical SAM protein [FCB group bacterium]